MDFPYNKIAARTKRYGELSIRDLPPINDTRNIYALNLWALNDKGTDRVNSLLEKILIVEAQIDSALKPYEAVSDP